MSIILFGMAHRLWHEARVLTRGIVFTGICADSEERLSGKTSATEQETLVVSPIRRWQRPVRAKQASLSRSFRFAQLALAAWQPNSDRCESKSRGSVLPVCASLQVPLPATSAYCSERGCYAKERNSMLAPDAQAKRTIQ